MKIKIKKYIIPFMIVMCVLLIYTHNLGEVIIEMENNSGKSPIESVEEEIVINQSFNVKSKKLAGIAIQFGTYMRENVGHVQLNLYNNKNIKLASARVSKKNLEDNQFYEWYFPPISTLLNNEFRLEIILQNDGENNQVTLYKNNDVDAQQLELQVNGEKVEGALNFKIYSIK